MTQTTSTQQLDIAGIAAALKGKVRGQAVAVTLFRDEIHPAYLESERVDACAILRIARDEDRPVHMNRENHDCSHGSFLTGFDDGDELIASGRLLPVFIPAYTDQAGLAVNSGKFRLPTGSMKGLGAAPLEKVPAGADIEWIVVVCEPVWASQIAAARAVEDGVQPSGAAGSSFCTDAFVTPFFDENVILTTGDFGGRMNNKLKPTEMFVIVPARWANNLISILGATPDVKGLYEATRTEESSYWARKKEREAKAEAREAAFAAGQTSGGGDDAAAKAGLKVSMDWDEDAVAMIAKAPKFVRKFAVGNMEDFAEQNGYDRITAEVVKEQMAQAGISGDGGPGGAGGGNPLKKLFGRKKKD
ncbi:unannotated protein [freshwater metagenome]|uniref:Unannotated protein n=1 Tax=freshwater metagenome TaxID=449393 RepID=A0A6J7ELJ0_9ZZZZ|nr:hypothetical protein [Actinomycetota bacterium]